jgi:gamma-glutamyltranspeptidase/glutathione hydrolase
MPGLVAAGHPATADAAARVLARGGNAVDAAVAATMASFVAEPLLSSAGGGGLLLAWDPKRGATAIDFFPPVPGVAVDRSSAEVALDFVGIELDFGATNQTFHVGRGSAAVPIVLDGLALALRERGRVSLETIAVPAIQLAREGAVIGRSGADVFHLLWGIVGREDATAHALCHATQGRPPLEHERVDNPELAGVLERWVEADGATPPELARGLLETFGPDAGGCISAADLAAARPSVLDPRQLRFRDWTVWTSPRAGGGSIEIMLEALGKRGDDEVERACRLADGGRRVAELRRGRRAPGSTTHISVADSDGAVASVTISNGEGSGAVIPGTGIHVNNFLGEEDLNPDGFFAHAPGDPLPTMMAPTIAQSPDGQIVALGTGGANRIRSAVTGTVEALTRGATLAEAIDAPRVHAEGDEVWIETAGWRQLDAIMAALDDRFDSRVAFDGRAFFFGGLHAVSVGPGAARDAHGDARRGGVVRRVG